MSPSVHGYLRFCFELSECAHRNVGAGAQVTGNNRLKSRRSKRAESRMRIGNSRFTPELLFISFKSWLTDVGDAEHRNGLDDSRPLGMIRRVLDRIRLAR
jgi:hypothetical protein